MASRSRIGDIRTRSLKASGDAEVSGGLGIGGLLSVTGGVSAAGSSTILSGSTFRILSTVPTTFTASGNPGQIAVAQSGNTATSGYLYLCFATNTWTRMAPTTQPAFN